MHLRQLEAFVVVAEELHFGRAAELLHISQPALSRQIDQLERELGVQLLRRTRRQVELTEAGAAYLDGLRAGMVQLDDAARTAQRLSSGEAGHLRIGHVDSAAYDVLPVALRRLRNALPAVEISMMETTSAATADGLQRRQFDVGMLRAEVTSEELEQVPLLEEPFVAALPEDHQAADQPSVEPSTLADEDFVVVTRGHSPAVHERVLELCRTAGFSPSITFHAAPLTATLPIVGAGLACAFVPVGLSRHMSVPGVVYRPLTAATTTLGLWAAWRRGDESPLVARFVATLRDVAADVDLVDGTGPLATPEPGSRKDFPPGNRT